MNNGDNAQVIVELLPEVRVIARQMGRHLPPHVSQEDLEQAGVIGLMQAAEKFDPHKGVPIKFYARLRIRGAIMDNLRELDWGPRKLRQQSRLLENARFLLSVSLSRDPEPAEVAAELGLPVHELWHLLAAVDTLDVKQLQDDDPAYLPYAPDADPFSLCALGEKKAIVARAISKLSQREREVLSLYYFEELTMKEVAVAIGVRQSRISQIHAHALSKLRAQLPRSLEHGKQKLRAPLNQRCPV